MLAEVMIAEVKGPSQIPAGWCWYSVNAPSGAIDPVEIEADSFDFEAFFHAHYQRTARVIARLVGDHSRAEDLAAEAFWKLWRTPRAHGGNAGGWLYRTAVRLGLNELRSGRRRERYEAMAGDPPDLLTPEEEHAAAEEREQVRQILAALSDRQAELLILRSSGLTYDELAAALSLNPASVGTLISRAQQAFRKEYTKHYGTRRNGR
jgi:RNA polymerase sigma-70 factor, ECF subfamily